MSGLQFRFSCLLTAMHYMVTTVGLELLRLGGVYESRASPLTPRLLLLVLLVGRWTGRLTWPCAAVTRRCSLAVCWRPW